MKFLSNILRRPYSGTLEPDTAWDVGLESAIALAFTEPAPLRSDEKRAEIEAERVKIDLEEAEHFVAIAYHEREIEKARKHLADLALCRDANDAAAAILNAGRAIDLTRTAEQEAYDIEAEAFTPRAETAADVERAA